MFLAIHYDKTTLIFKANTKVMPTETVDGAGGERVLWDFERRDSWQKRQRLLKAFPSV